MFELANPWFLTLLPLPIVIWFCLARSKVILPVALKVPFFEAMQGIVAKEKHSTSTQSIILIPCCIWLLLVIAVSGPRWIGEPRPVSREGFNIMMALDLSGSMEINDMLVNGSPVSRLSVVKNAAQTFVSGRFGDKIGLILFGTRAYLQTPLTYDRQNVLLRIDDATAGLAGKTTSIGDAVGLAVKRLNKVPEKGRMIILLTDGANNSGFLPPLKAAELAKDDDIKIYTIGLGSDAEAGTFPDFFGQNLSADLDEDTLKQMAEMTGGRYFRATDTETLGSIYKTIDQLEKVEHDTATIRPQKDYYPWFVGLALVFSMYWLSSRLNLFTGLNVQKREVIES
jgi:Ca-activated chloride channel family protein